MTTLTQERKAKIPTLTDDPQYREAVDQHLKAQLDLGEVRRRIAEVHDRLNGARLTEQGPDRVEDAARKYIGGEQLADAKLSALNDQLAALYTRCAVLERAEQILRRKRDEEGDRAARALFAGLKPVHDEIAAAIARKAADLAAEVERFRAFSDACDGAGLRSGLRAPWGPVLKMVRREPGYPSDLGGAGAAIAWAELTGAVSPAEADRLLGFKYRRSDWI